MSNILHVTMMMANQWLWYSLTLVFNSTTTSYYWLSVNCPKLESDCNYHTFTCADHRPEQVWNKRLS